MSYFEAFILGLLQGLTEFLPVSSSGHIEIGKTIFGLHPKNEMLFTIIVHGATVLSTIVVFRKDLKNVITGLILRKSEQTIYSGKLILSAVPVAIVGLLFQKQISEHLFGSIVVVGVSLCVTGLVLLLVNYSKPQGKPVGYLHSIIIGLSQVIAIIPGISRSGATISTALLLGISREEAARFSFLMVLIPVIGANFLTITKSGWIEDGFEVMPLIIGFVTAFISGYIACKWIVSVVKKGKLSYFAVYCFLIGILALTSHYFL